MEPAHLRLRRGVTTHRTGLLMRSKRIPLTSAICNKFSHKSSKISECSSGGGGSMRSQILDETIKVAMVTKCLRLFVCAILFVLLSSFHSKAQNMHKPSTGQTTIDKQCVTNLKIVYKMIKLNLHHSGGVTGFPPDLDEIYLMTKDPKLFICPGDKQINANMKPDTFLTIYEVVNDPLKPQLSTTPPDRIAIVAEKRPNHNDQRFVLFYDGSVKAFDNPHFDRLKNNSFIDAETNDTNH
jgi:hypothetical protein